MIVYINNIAFCKEIQLYFPRKKRDPVPSNRYRRFPSRSPSKLLTMVCADMKPSHGISQTLFLICIAYFLHFIQLIINKCGWYDFCFLKPRYAKKAIFANLYEGSFIKSTCVWYDSTDGASKPQHLPREGWDRQRENYRGMTNVLEMLEHD